MTEQHHPQPVQGVTAPSLSTAGPSTNGLNADGLSADAKLDRAWAEFSQARASLAEVMSDDELRAFGINVEALDERP